MEYRIAMRDERKLHVIARAKGIDLFLILGHFLADLLKILSVHGTSFFYFITHNKGFISASIKPNTGVLRWIGKRMEDRNKLVNNRLVGNTRYTTMILPYLELLKYAVITLTTSSHLFFKYYYPSPNENR